MINRKDSSRGSQLCYTSLVARQPVGWIGSLTRCEITAFNPQLMDQEMVAARHVARSSWGEVAAVELGGHMKKIGSCKGCKVQECFLSLTLDTLNYPLADDFPIQKNQIVDNHDDPLPLDNEENENGFSRKCCLLSSKPSPGRQSLFGHSQVVGPLIRSWGLWSTDTSLCSCHSPAVSVEVSLKFQLERCTVHLWARH